MASFLLNRTQTVKIGNVLSNEGHPNGGVPQGTLSGPKDFLIHINQLKTECPLFKYVDDCTIFECLTKPMVSRIQLSLDELCAWSTENHMRVNRTKTKEIIMDFSASNSVAEIPLLAILDEPIERVTHATVLRKGRQRLYKCI